jgi:hypothetical protein
MGVCVVIPWADFRFEMAWFNLILQKILNDHCLITILNYSQKITVIPIPHISRRHKNKTTPWTLFSCFKFRLCWVIRLDHKLTHSKMTSLYWIIVVITGKLRNFKDKLQTIIWNKNTTAKLKFPLPWWRYTVRTLEPEIIITLLWWALHVVAARAVAVSVSSEIKTRISLLN